MSRPLIFLSLITLTIVSSAKAACRDGDFAFDSAVAKADYVAALTNVLDDLKVPVHERKSFVVDAGLTDRVRDVHGQADAATLRAHLAPALFQEGKRGACEGVAHERAHLTQFKTDREALDAVFTESKDVAAEQEAFENLQDNDLLPHAAAHEINAVLAQAEISGQPLHDEDQSYLLENLVKFAESRNVLKDSSNERFYPSVLKRSDEKIFCRGVRFVAKSGDVPVEWKQACGL